MRSILHISDIHFGPPHLPDRSQGVLETIRRRQPDVVVISGDLTQRAKPHQFRQAREFVESIHPPTVVVPGNHDVPLYRFWERIFRPFGAYREHFDPKLEPVHQESDLVIVGINTAFNWTITGGRILPQRLSEVGRIFRQAPESALKIVVAHHQLIPPPNFGGQQVLLNASQAVDEFADAGVDLVLSGHLHQTYGGSSASFYPNSRGSVVILHAGTTTSRRGRGEERHHNTCNWIEVEAESLQVSHCRWDSNRKEFTERSQHRYRR